MEDRTSEGLNRMTTEASTGNADGRMTEVPPPPPPPEEEKATEPAFRSTTTVESSSSGSSSVPRPVPALQIDK